MYSKILSAIMTFAIFFSCTHKQLIERRNREIKDTCDYELYEFSTEFDIFRFKNNILNIKFGIISGKVHDYRIYAENEQAHINFIYSFFSDWVFDYRKSFEKSKIEYQMASEREKYLIYKEYIKPFNKNDEHYRKLVNNKHLDSCLELNKRLSYYLINSDFYKTQKDFEYYLENRTISLVDRELLQNILGEYTLSLSGLTNQQKEKFELLDINFLIVFSGTTHSKYEDSIGLSGGYISYEDIHAKIIYVNTSEIVSTTNITVYF